MATDNSSPTPPPPAAPAPSAKTHPVRRGCGTVCLVVVAIVVWYFLVTYDVRLWVIGPTLMRYVHYPIEPEIAQQIGPLPADGHALEDWVKANVKDKRDIDVYNLPWYFATPHETLAKHAGDCEAQTVVLASLMTAYGLPYLVRTSFSHMWVDYPGRVAPSYENTNLTFISNDHGRYHVKWPNLPDIARNLSVQKWLLYDGIRPARKVLLWIGWVGLSYGIIRRRRRRRPVGASRERGSTGKAGQ